MSAELRSLPSIEKLISAPALRSWDNRLIRQVRVRLARELVTELRASVTRGESLPAEIEAMLGRRYDEFLDLGLKRVINATGVLLHTNLGRAPLGESVLADLARELPGYLSLEFDLDRGERGSRTAAVDRLNAMICGAPASLVVNNCASALFLTLHALARGREVILSRGELVQIGGGFRLPDILEASGARLREVGTTNITRTADFEKALGSETAMLLKVHQSCFTIEGHTQSVSPAELAGLAKKAKVPFVVDLGSGQLVDAHAEEPTIEEALGWGSDLVLFSGDKLLGGPQAGIIVGSKEKIAVLRASPLYRALRLGKTEIFLLERAMLAHAKGESLPTQTMLAESLGNVRARAERLHGALAGLPGLTLREDFSSIGGGTPPSRRLPTWLVEVAPADAERVARRLLAARPPVVARREKKRIGIDVRTLRPGEDLLVAQALREALA